MSFLSGEFVVFFSISTLLFFRVPHRFKIPYLLLISLIFYGYSYPAYILLLLGAAGIDFGIARGIGDSGSASARARLLILSLTINIGTLLLFKYADFLNQSLARVFNVAYQPGDVGLVMPLGISFFTFTKIAYVVDVYRRKYAPERSLIPFATFVSFFPNVISGPIERADHLIPQLKASLKFDEARVVEGFRLILWGAFKKVVIADRLALYVNAVYDQPQAHQGLTLITATLFFAFQIYADFSGYTDMARGIARVLGFDLFENFRQPYLAASILDFWRRWHISLTTWIREYLFFPLSRYLLKKTNRRIPRAVEVTVYLIVMSLVGLWHGANWTFVAWGGLHGIYMGAEALLNARRIRLMPPSRWTNMVKIGGTFLLVAFAWIFFRANSIADAGSIVRHLFDFGGDFWASFSGVYTTPVGTPQTQLLISVGLIVILMAADWLDARRGLFNLLSSLPALVRWAVYYALTMLIVVALVSVNVVETFVYFRF